MTVGGGASARAAAAEHDQVQPELHDVDAGLEELRGVLDVRRALVESREEVLVADVADRNEQIVLELL